MKHFIIAMFIGLMINLIMDPNIKLIPIVCAYATEMNVNYYDGTPYKGVRNFDEWMIEWRKDVDALLKKQKIEWGERFGKSH